MSTWLPKREAPPRFLLTASPEGTRSHHSTGTVRIQIPRHVCRPVAMDNLSFRLAALALGGGDNMLNGRPRDPEFPRDRGWVGAGLEGGGNQSLLSRRYGGGPVCWTRFRRRRFWWLGPFHLLPRFGRKSSGGRVPVAGPLRPPPSRADRAARRPAGATSGRNRLEGPDPAPAVGSFRFPAFASRPSPCPPAAVDPGRPSPLPISPSIRVSVIRRKSFGMTKPIFGPCAGTLISASVKRYGAAMGYSLRDRGRDHPLSTASSYPLGRRPGAAPACVRYHYKAAFFRVPVEWVDEIRHAV